jgi:thiol-disulfide isomerase/thioredoxin
MVKFLKNALKKFKKLPIILKVVLFLGMFFLVRVGMDALLWGDKSNYENEKENKEQEGMGNGKKMYLFHWKNCGHCKKMKPDWDAFENDKPADVEVKAIEKDDNDPLNKEYADKIQGYPTIIGVDSNGNVKDYTGGRTKDEFKAFAKKL